MTLQNPNFIFKIERFKIAFCFDFKYFSISNVKFKLLFLYYYCMYLLCIKDNKYDRYWTSEYTRDDIRSHNKSTYHDILQII